MHKPNPAKFYAPMYFQYLKMFHVCLYLELPRFFLPIAKEFGRKTFSEIFERKSARLLRRDYFTFNLETNYWNSNSDFISCAFYVKTLSTKALITSQSICSTSLHIASIAASPLWNIFDGRVKRHNGHTGSHKLRFRKKNRIFADLLSISQYPSLLDKKHGTKVQ